MANSSAGKPGLVSITKKILMAVTGLALCVFLVLHLFGNTLMLFGPTAFNNYAHILMTWPPLVYTFEIGLAALFLIHAYEGIQVFQNNKRARAQGYEVRTWAKTKNAASRKSVSSTSMIVTGVIILVFLVLHVGHFKFAGFGMLQTREVPLSGIALGVSGGGAATGEHSGMHDLYHLVATEFKKPVILILYLLCMAALGLHLNHAIFSASQTVGVNNKKLEKPIWLVGRAFTIVIAGGFILLPIIMFFKPLPPDTTAHTAPTAMTAEPTTSEPTAETASTTP